MKKYLGSPITMFAGVLVPFYIIGPVVFAISALLSEISSATIVLTVGCVSCAIIWGIYTKKILRQLYTWGVFKENLVQVKTIFYPQYEIEYEKCRCVGIGYYNHNAIHSNFGTKVFFIIFSYDYVQMKDKININMWKPTDTQVKVKFNLKLYSYLLSVLPPKQALMLKRDYEKFIARK